MRFHREPVQKQDGAVTHPCPTGEVPSLGPSNTSYAGCGSPGHLGSWDRGVLERLFHLGPLSSHRASTSANVRVTTWGTGCPASQSSCPWTAACRTMGSATRTPTAPTSTSRVSIAGRRGLKHLSVQAWEGTFRRGKRETEHNVNRTKRPCVAQTQRGQQGGRGSSGLAPEPLGAPGLSVALFPELAFPTSLSNPYNC